MSEITDADVLAFGKIALGTVQWFSATRNPVIRTLDWAPLSFGYLFVLIVTAQPKWFYIMPVVMITLALIFNVWISLADEHELPSPAKLCEKHGTPTLRKIGQKCARIAIAAVSEIVLITCVIVLSIIAPADSIGRKLGAM